MSTRTFLELKKNLKFANEGLPTKRMAIVGDCATQHLSTAIQGWSVERGLRLEVFEADYDQISAQILDSSSELYAHVADYLLVVLCVEKLYEKYCKLEAALRPSFAQREFDALESLWATFNKSARANVLQTTFIEKDDGTFGNFALKVPGSFTTQVKKLNGLIAEGSQKTKNVFLVDVQSEAARMGLERACSDKLYYMAKVPWTMEFIPRLAKSVVDVVMSIFGRTIKAVVLDLDNTLWGGVIGDDGMNGIQLGDLGLGHAFADLQVWLKELKSRGIILAVCSKNNEATAREPFETHPDMVLRLTDIAVFVANWDDKASNIRAIQQTLNIGMDAMVFLDDNPFERQVVKNLIPEIVVPELPEDPAEYVSYLRSLNLFETASFSEADGERVALYQAELARKSLESSFASYDDFLSSLEMVAEVVPFGSFNGPRVAQLSQRSNQFNLRTIRLNEADVETLAQDPRFSTLAFSLRDRIGDHGLIGAVILDRQDPESWFIHTWFMSCRVLKRGMEEFIVNAMIREATSHGAKALIGEYLPTSKNGMVADLYQRMGFSPEGDGRFRYETGRGIVLKNWIST